MINLQSLGWDSFFENEFKSIREDGFEVGRIAVENKGNYLLYTKYGEMMGEVTGKLLYTSESKTDLPKVGDWVVISIIENENKALIRYVLKRKSKLSRKLPDKSRGSFSIATDEQIIATNIDIVFIVQSLDNNYNTNRLQRYLVIAHQNEIRPVIILNKVDLCPDYESKVAEVKEIAPDIPVLPTSCKTNFGISALNDFIKEGITVVFVGSSGVGKSSIINKLFGYEIQETGEARKKNLGGKHITTKRDLLILPNNGLVIDTPGMREIQLFDGEDGITETFADIEELALNCHFSDCTHTVEMKCAVISAVKNGQITEKHYNNYLKLQKELSRLEESQFKKKKRKKAFGKLKKEYNKENNKYNL